jgi:hypothetical protein
MAIVDPMLERPVQTWHLLSELTAEEDLDDVGVTCALAA